MSERPNRVRVSSLVAALLMAAGPIALAQPADETPSRPTGSRSDRIVLAMDQQDTPGGSGPVTPATAPKVPASTPKAPASTTTAAPKAPASTAAAAPKDPASAPSFLPKAGANSTPASPGVGASRNPYRPQSVDMIRQSNRLKASGYGSNVMNDGEIVLALNAAIKLLAKVEEGYGGHRTKAIQEIEDGIHQIKTKAGKAGVKSVTPPRNGSKPAMSQAESDAYLREAQKALEKIVFQINHGGNVKRLAPARASVQKAIQELGTALEAR